MTSSRLTLKQANTMIDSCLEEGRSLGLRPLAAVVLDVGGNLVAFQRHETCNNLSARIVIAKASGALSMGVSSRQLGVMATAMPGFIATVSPLSPDGIIPAAGALLIIDADNSVLGVIAAAGDVPDNDERRALAGVSAAGLSVRG